jgi:uncharacterized protein (TIGR02594 family)
MQGKPKAPSKTRKKKTPTKTKSAGTCRVTRARGAAKIAAAARAIAPAARRQAKIYQLPAFAAAIGLAMVLVLAAVYSTQLDIGAKQETTSEPRVVEVRPLPPSPAVLVEPPPEPASPEPNVPQAEPPTEVTPQLLFEASYEEREQRRKMALRRRNAERVIGLRTIDPRAIVGMASAHPLIAEARRYLGTNPTGRASLWCGAFLDMVLKRVGYKGGGNLASAYAKYGKRISGPQVGAIAVMYRQGGGHVGIVTGFDANGNPIIISGNYNKRVAEAVFPPSRIYAYVVPEGAPAPQSSN